MRHLGFAFLASCFLSLLIACGGGGSSSGGNPGGGNPGGGTTLPAASNTPFWAQWGANPQHSGLVTVAGQSTTHQLADIVYDPFVTQEQAEQGGDLVAHYPAPIIDGNDVYIEVKTGTYTACTPAGNWRTGALCGPNAWETQVWNEARYYWQNNTLTRAWMFPSDWKPPTNGGGLGGWEPVFHPVDANNVLYVPGAGGTIWKVNKDTGSSAAHINPFGNTGLDLNKFITSPISADAQGNIYYNVIGLAPRAQGDPWTANDTTGAWLVKITPADVATIVSYATLVPNAPAAASVTCPGRFTTSASLPWPPSPTAIPPATSCGSQRPGVNVAPVIAPDGTIYTVSRAHFNQRTTYLVAVNPNLTPKWVASMQNVLNDGCGVLVPIAPASDPLQPGSCRTGTALGVDPTTNALGTGAVIDQSSSSPTVLPDGSILFGAMTNYNGARGHLLKYSSAGAFQGSYDFGWDSTPAVWTHGGTYSIVIKDNHYETGGYCNFANPACQLLPDGPYYITQLSPQMQVEWKFQGTNTQSCSRNANGTLNCVSDHPNGFEWCINMPAVDMNGTVFVNSEDGNIYSLPQGHSGVFTAPGSAMFLNLAIGAAYTPLSIGPDGRLYTQNDGHLFVVGN
jgi:hypothetical protein